MSPGAGNDTRGNAERRAMVSTAHQKYTALQRHRNEGLLALDLGVMPRGMLRLLRI